MFKLQPEFPLVPSRSKFPSSIISCSYYLLSWASSWSPGFYLCPLKAIFHPATRAIISILVFAWNPPMASQFTQGKSQTPSDCPLAFIQSGFFYSLHASHTGLCAAPQTDKMDQPSWSKICSLECSFSALYIACSLTF